MVRVESTVGEGLNVVLESSVHDGLDVSGRRGSIEEEEMSVFNIAQ